MKNILFSLCLLLFASCTRDVVLVLPPVPPRLVLNASVSPDTDVTAFLSKSWFVLDTVTDDGVEEGDIKVFITIVCKDVCNRSPIAGLRGGMYCPDAV